MIQITPTEIGWPKKLATQIHIHTLPISVTDITCGVYYQLFSEINEPLADGNLQLDEEQFAKWGDSMDYIADFTLNTLKLNRLLKTDIENLL